MGPPSKESTLTALAPALFRVEKKLPKPLVKIPSWDALTPGQALERLLAGNSRFASGKALGPNRSLERLSQTADVPTPLAAFLGCADSRVPVELVFDQGFGDLFVTRVAGNVATQEEIASLEYGTAVLGAKVVFILGHTGCGAVSAACSGQSVPGQISSLFRHLKPAVRAAHGDVDLAVRENVRFQAEILMETSPLIANLIKQGSLLLACGVYQVTTGKVALIDL